MSAEPFKPTFFILFVVLCSTSMGSRLVFEKTPDVVLPPFTHDMALRCSINNTFKDDILVGRDISRADHGTVDLLNAIMIYRTANETDSTKEYLAGITHKAPAIAMKNTRDTMKVTGGIDDGSSELGYLELTWKNPSYNQVGIYYCEVNGMGQFGEPVLMEKSVEVLVRSPDLQDLVQKIYQYEDESKEQAQKFKTELAEYRLGTGYNDSYEGMVMKIHDLEQELNDLKNETTHSKHIEMGSNDCGSGTAVNKDKFLPFKQKYDRAPQVYITGINHYEEKLDKSKYYIRVSSTNTTGFNLYCEVNAVSDFHWLVVSWISLPI